ncbi:MAG: hypothetical protein AB2421_02165 [Thermotaleaceae bacterium]
MYPYYFYKPFIYNTMYPSAQSISNSIYPHHTNFSVLMPSHSITTIEKLESPYPYSKYYLSLENPAPFSYETQALTHVDLQQTKSVFHDLLQQSVESALDFLNEESLTFPSLYLLRLDIENWGLFHRLNGRNKTALVLTKEILANENTAYSIESLSCDYIHNVHAALKWMLETGFSQDGLDNDYDIILDTAAILDVKLFHEKRILPIIVEMIFNRVSKGLFTHDLIWAFFEARDPYSLMLIANRLKSRNEKVAAFARKLLGFIPGMDTVSPNDFERQYTLVQNWLEENSPFLYYTGESLQQTNQPIPYVILLEAKYLCKAVAIDSGKFMEPLTNHEKNLLRDFYPLKLDTKIALTNCSFLLHQRDKMRWKMWLQNPISEQVHHARSRMGVGL